MKKPGNLGQPKKSQCYAKHSSKTKKQHYSHGPHNWKSTVFTPSLRKFPLNPRTHFFVSPLLVFHTDSTCVKISSNTFWNLKILYKM